MTMPPLPPLPSPAVRILHTYADVPAGPLFSQQQMQDRATQAAREAYEAGRLSMREEAKSVCANTCSSSNDDFGHGYNRAAIDCEQAIGKIKP